MGRAAYKAVCSMRARALGARACVAAEGGRANLEEWDEASCRNGRGCVRAAALPAARGGAGDFSAPAAN